jgi:uncharacterized RDD family membrane protein YckC
MTPGNPNPYAAPSADLDRGLGAETGQPVLADRGTRLGAALLDGLIGFLVPTVLFAAGGGLASAAGGSDEAMGIGMIIAMLWVAAFVVIYLWQLVTRGQSPGKRILGIRIVKLDGSPVTFGTVVILRWLVPGLLGIIPLFSLVDILFIFRDDRRCIHDLIATTKVVRA